MKRLNGASYVMVVLGAGLAFSGCAGAGRSLGPAVTATKVTTPGERAFQEAQSLAAEGRWGEAADRFAVAVRLEPTKRAALINQGIALEHSGDLKAAAEIYRQACDADPADEQAASLLARAALAVRDYATAGRVVGEALKRQPEDAKLLLTWAVISRGNEQFEHAAQAARKVLLRDQKNVEAMKTLAMVYADQGKLELADTFFRNALKLDPDDASIVINLGLLAYRQGKHQRAMAEFEKVLEKAPDNAVAHANLGAIALRFRDYKRAGTHYQRALELGMVNCTTQSALGYAMEGLQAGEAAVKQLEKAYELCPQQGEILYTIGQVCMNQLRDNDCAFKYFQRYAKTDKGTADPRNVRQYIESIESSEASESEKQLEAAAPVEAPAGENAAGVVGDEEGAGAPEPAADGAAVEADGAAS